MSFYNKYSGEGVRGFDDVIVGRDHGVAARRPGRIGQKRDRTALPGLGGREVEVGGQLVDRFHACTSLRDWAVECAVTATPVGVSPP